MASVVVIDLRHNSGGDNTTLRPLLIAIARSRLNHRGHLFVLIGPYTFSAAQSFTNRLENVIEAIFVGQPTGSNVNQLQIVHIGADQVRHLDLAAETQRLRQRPSGL